MRALGLDVGDRRIGVASGDTETAIAIPVRAIERRRSAADVIDDADLQAVLDLAHDRDADMLVVGLPLSLSGASGPQAASVQRFVDALKERTALDVVTVDERLTTVEAERRLREARGGRLRTPRGAKGVVDSAAAAVILQAWLDARRVSSGL